ncbi:hypothetical protein EYR27_14075 [Xanthomonas oryzae]|nr:hypothetical protein EYR27_14075 [Xanthomonas oryzae]
MESTQDMACAVGTAWRPAEVHQHGRAARPGQNAHLVTPAVSTHAVSSYRSTHHRPFTKPARAPRTLQRTGISGALNARSGGARCARNSSNQRHIRRSIGSDALHSFHHVEHDYNAARGAGHLPQLCAWTAACTILTYRTLSSQ